MMLPCQLSKLKFGIFVIIVSLGNLTGCATQQVSTNDMLQFKTNCAQKEQQIAFLDSVQTNQLDQIWAGLKLTFMGPFTPNFETTKDIATGSSRYWVQNVKESVMRCGEI
jgi:hypothetical protein